MIKKFFFTCIIFPLHLNTSAEVCDPLPGGGMCGNVEAIYNITVIAASYTFMSYKYFSDPYLYSNANAYGLDPSILNINYGSVGVYSSTELEKINEERRQKCQKSKMEKSMCDSLAQSTYTRAVRQCDDYIVIPSFSIGNQYFNIGIINPGLYTQQCVNVAEAKKQKGLADCEYEFQFSQLLHCDS